MLEEILVSVTCATPLALHKVDDRLSSLALYNVKKTVDKNYLLGGS